jgi:hypothetical protein
MFPSLRTLLVSLPATLAWFGPVSGAVIVLTPDADAGLREGSPDINAGIASDYIVGHIALGETFRALLRFNLEAIPTNAVIQLAQLSVTDVSRQGAQAPASFGLHRVLRPWTEGTNFGFGIQPGEVSWNSARHGQTAWESPGASGPSDAVATTSGAAGSGGVSLNFVSTPGLVADLQHWLVQPQSNFGWLLYTDQENTPRSARRLAAREHPVSPPRLTVHYVVPTPPVLELAEMQSGGAVRVRGSGTPGTVVKVEYSTDLKVWTAVGTPVVDPTGRVELLHDVVAGNGQVRRFYRFAE